MDTHEIRYRVVDFLKKHAPFHAVDDSDLLAMAAGGRVRFHEAHDYILWQGEPHKAYVFVIQQGSVSLWDESGGRAELRDVRGAGDALGLERYHEARACLHSAKAESDTVLYGFPADAFERHVLKYSYAAQYVSAEGRVTADYQVAGGRRDARKLFLHDIAGRRPVPTCLTTDSIAEATRHLLASRAEAVAVIDTDLRAHAVLTATPLLKWLAAGGGDAQAPISTLALGAPVAFGPTTTVADGVLALGAADAEAAVITSDGTGDGAVQMLFTGRDLPTVFGEQPIALLRDIRRASTRQELGELNRRSRSFLQDALTSAATVEWLARFAHLTDTAIVTKILELEGADATSGCWCFCGSSGRGEVLTARSPYLLLILDASSDQAAAEDTYRRVMDALHESHYLPRLDLPFPPAFHVASASAWKERYRAFVTDPVIQRTYRARALFDLRPVYGDHALWRDLESVVMAAVDQDFIQILANDCLSSLPPLTFFENDVVDRAGEHSTVFKLEQSALAPLVDVGRVFGMASRQVMGRTTFERLASARRLLPEQEAIFRDASETLRVVLWQQARVGICEGTEGFELPPSLLSRYDRQVLRGGFRSILRLLEYTAERSWIQRA